MFPNRLLQVFCIESPFFCCHQKKGAKKNHRCRIIFWILQSSGFPCGVQWLPTFLERETFLHCRTPPKALLQPAQPWILRKFSEGGLFSLYSFLNHFLLTPKRYLPKISQKKNRRPNSKQGCGYKNPIEDFMFYFFFISTKYL